MGQVRARLGIQKSTTGDPSGWRPRQALHHAMLQNARAVAPGESIITLAPGRRADIILVDLPGQHLQPIHDLAASVARASPCRPWSTPGARRRPLQRVEDGRSRFGG
jgi:5-methylthioadenosine/S-adenosylhomocysteine deaminase